MPKAEPTCEVASCVGEIVSKIVRGRRFGAVSHVWLCRSAKIARRVSRRGVGRPVCRCPPLVFSVEREPLQLSNCVKPAYHSTAFDLLQAVADLVKRFDWTALGGNRDIAYDWIAQA